MSSPNTTDMKAPANSKALVLESIGSPLNLKSVPTPQAIPGSAVVRMLASYISSGAKDQIAGNIPYLNFPTPLVPGASGIGRVAATGPDAASLRPGQLVYIDPFIAARDDPNKQIILGLHSGSDEGSQRLIGENWRDASWAEYTRIPLENCFPLNEELLCGRLGYTFSELTYINTQMVSYGGLRSVGLKPGETVLITPATGGYSGAAVEVASAMGATVIAASRNAEILQKIEKSVPFVKALQITGDVEKDTLSISQHGPIDVYFDITPASAQNQNHITAAFNAIQPNGRMVFMGSYLKNIELNYIQLMLKNVTIRGQYMYEKEDMKSFIQLVESGRLKIGTKTGLEKVKEYALEDWEKALDDAATNGGWGRRFAFKF